MESKSTWETGWLAAINQPKEQAPEVVKPINMVAENDPLWFVVSSSVSSRQPSMNHVAQVNNGKTHAVNQPQEQKLSFVDTKSTVSHLGNADSTVEPRNSFIQRMKDKYSDAKEYWTRRRASAVLMGGLALAGTGLASCDFLSAKKAPSLGTAPITKAIPTGTKAIPTGCNLSLTKEKPSNFANYAFFPSNKANNSSEAASVEASLFKNGPIGGNASQGTIALMETVIADQAYSGQTVNNQLELKNGFSQNYNLMNGQGGKVQAEKFCTNLTKVMGETESYNSNFAVKGSQLIWLKAEYNSKKEIVGVNPVQVTYNGNTPLSGIENSSPQDAARLGINGFDPVLEANNGQVYLSGSLPTGGSNETKNAGTSGNQSSPQPQPTGAKTKQKTVSKQGTSANPSKAPTAGIGNTPGGSASAPTKNLVTGVGPSPGGEQSSSNNASAPGPTTETAPVTTPPTTETAPVTTPPTTETAPVTTTTTSTVPSTTTTTTSTVPSTTTTTTSTVPSTTTTVLKPADPGATATNSSGTGQSDPFNAGGPTVSGGLPQ